MTHSKRRGGKGIFKSQNRRKTMGSRQPERESYERKRRNIFTGKNCRELLTLNKNRGKIWGVEWVKKEDSLWDRL